MSRYGASVQRVRALLLVAGAALLALALSSHHHSAAPSVGGQDWRPLYSAVGATYPGDAPAAGEGSELAAQSAYWNDRVTYPTGRFDPAWLRHGARQDARVPRGVPAGGRGHQTSPSFAAMTSPDTTATAASSTLATGSFTPLGPRPLHMTGCSGCFDYGTTAGRVNAIVVDPRSTTPGSITAYAATVGGGVWKTTNCCGSNTTWSVTTDSINVPDLSTDALALDPNNPDTIYAGTGDLSFGSWSMGSQGVLKSTDGGASWTDLGVSTFGAALNPSVGHFPQYQAVGKVAVDPNNSQNVVAGAKTGVYVSHDAGANWQQCATNSFNTQRQDVTGLALVDNSGTTRVLAAIGTRGYGTPVQDDLNKNGANGVYRATLGNSGCPSFTAVTTDNTFRYGAAVSGSPYATNAALHATSGTPYGGNATTGNQLGRIDLAVAPNNPQVVYVQVQSIAPNTDSGCGGAQGCQLGVWASTDGGTTWTMLTGSAGPSLGDCSKHSADYNQNWYDQSIAVDPNNADRIYVGTFDQFFATRTGTSFNDVTCAYPAFPKSSGTVHADQHAATFVPGSSSTLLLGDDGGVHVSANADTATSSTDPTFTNLDGGFNTIEFYSGDISANFATSGNPVANGGAQDNGSSSVQFNGSPTGPAQWQMGKGGDGFYARIDPVSGALYQGNNDGHIWRCTASCTSAGAAWTDITNSTMNAEQQSFILPYEIYRGVPGSPNDCSATTCNHLIAGTTGVWENDNALSGSASSWYANSPALTKASSPLTTRAFINQLAFSPATATLAIVGTNDGNVQVGRGLGAGVANSATWVNVTGSNAVLPNRPILDVAMDPGSLNTVGSPVVGYAAVGGFDENTPSTPGHVFRLVCTTNCASATWTDKTGNLPNIPVDSIIANPNNPQQVFAGTDLGLYYTDDITVATPTWTRFAAGLPRAMVWDLQIDRGATTLSVWTRGRGAYVWPLPGGTTKQSQTITVSQHAPSTATYGAQFTVAATADSGLPVSYGTSGGCTNSGATVTVTSGSGTCTVTYDQAGDSQYLAAPQVSESVTLSPAGTSTSISVTPGPGNPAPQVSDTVDLSSTVSLASTDAGTSAFSGNVQFKLAGVAVGAPQPVSNSAPTASLSVPLASASAGDAFSAVFTSSTSHYAGSSSGNAAQTVRHEGERNSGAVDGSTRLRYSGNRVVTAGVAPTLTATLLQSLEPETADAEYVDFSARSVPVVFDVYDADCTGGCPSSPVWSSSSVDLANASGSTTGQGTASTTGPTSLAAGAYLVRARLATNPVLDAEVAVGTLVVHPSSGMYVAAAGTIANDSTSNVSPPTGNFGIFAKPGAGGPSGASVYSYRMRIDVSANTPFTTCTTLGGSCHDVDVTIRSVGLSSLSFTTTSRPYKAHVVGGELVEVVDAADGTTHFGTLESSGGAFRVDATDAKKNSGDRYGFSAYLSGGGLFHQAFLPTTGALTQSGTGSKTNVVHPATGSVVVRPA